MASMRRLWQTYFSFLLLSSISAFQLSPLSPYLVNSFCSNATLNHFTVAGNGSVYIGALDHLYHLSQNFDVYSQEEFQNRGEDNVNKILEIIPFPVKQLISCGTGLNGTCQLRNLSDISQVVSYLSFENPTIAPKDDSTVGRVVKEASGRISLYVAQTVREDRLSRRPISSICLHSADQFGGRDDDYRRTNGLSNTVPNGFVIQYVAVFSYQGYTYFIASQRRDASIPDSPFVSKMSRVCHNDISEELFGFTEITLECKGNDGTLYSIAQSATEVNDRLYVVFVKNIPEDGPNFKRANQSALCMYEMEKLKTEFEASIVNCTCNKGTSSNNNYLDAARCSMVMAPPVCDTPELLTCNPPSALESRYPERKAILGDLPGFFIFEGSGMTFSSVMVTEMDQPIRTYVAFIGTREGTFIKVHFDVDRAGVLYEVLEVGYPVLRDPRINEQRATIMFITEKQLLEIKVANCSQYQTCEECIKPGSDEGDPYCGWCTLEKRCTIYEHCKSSSIQSRWLWYTETSCSVLTDVTPSSLSIDADPQMVVSTLSHLPVPGDFNYTCHFGPNFTSVATHNNSLLSCLSPGVTDIPEIPDGDDAVEVVFGISTTEFNISFVKTSYTFFNCSRIKGCTDCVSRWTCDWCIDELRCMYDLNSTCYNITSSNSSDVCPQLIPGQAVVPSGVNREINVTARNLNLTPGLLDKEYECVMKAQDESISETFVSSASILGRSNSEYNVTCSSTEYSYELEKQEIPMFLTLRWKNTGVFLDGVFNVTLYKCNIDRPDCSRCLSNETTDAALQCRWCSAPQGFCTVEENCSPGLLLHECSDPPRITLVSPTSSPIEGGTIVEINGTDLGQRFSDIVNVSLAGVVCLHQNYFDEYQVGGSLTCRTGNSSSTREGKVLLFLLNKTEAEYKDQFSYNDPNITSIYPMVGPKSGGTLITISGIDLQTGRDIRVEVGERICNITSNSTTSIVCKNEGLPGNESSPGNQTVSVTFDGHERFATEKFAYHQDPIVTEVMPERTIMSGGNWLTVTGERFHLIEKPKIQFTVNGNSAEEECFSQNEMEIMCKSPSVVPLLEERSKRAESTAEGMVVVGFIMDGVTELLRWSENNSVVFEYFRDPKYETFDVLDHHQQMTDNFLTLNGTDLNLASSITDVTVYVGTERCEVRSLDTNTLICELPSEQPEPSDLYGNKKSKDLPLIVVRHANLEFDIGYIRYTVTFDILWIIIPVSCALVIVIIIIFLVSAWAIRRKKNEKLRDLELQVRNIHDSVSANLKTLFATLQTTMHDFETDVVEQTRVPILDKRQYLLHMMFLGLDVNPSVSPPEENVENSKLSAAMEEFSKLLHHKSFLKVLITTMDNTTGISVMDRANAGSLLSICLLQNGKLGLYTDLLLSLMQENIEECDSKGKQRILFSRNDTMLEKLISNWVVIFLYGFLKKQAASEVYQLYEAIKYVCELGPIDAVSGKSQFSINDQQMLETQINFDEVKLDVITNSVSGEKKPLKVLDVNSVTQVKERIISHNYRNVPYSKRPSPFMVDLMWRTGRSGQLILRDDESFESLPGTLEKEWKKISTLKDLNVQSDSTFELITKQENPNAKLFSGEKGEQTDSNGISRESHLYLGSPDDESHQQETFNAASNNEIVQSKRKTYDVNVREGVRVWHLIKEDQEDLLEENDENETRPHKEIKEVVLPFLPATRNYIQKYVDNLINAIFAADDGADVPLSIKYLFQFFDQEAEKAGKPELSKAWKNNVLPLRYWSTIVANPQYVLDVGVYTYTHASLRILVQVIKDTCVGRAKVYKNKDFSPSRLLYSNFLKQYISKLDNYYLFIRNLGRVDSEDLRQECEKVEQEFQNTFHLTSTQQKLFSFVADRQNELINVLEEDDVCSELSLATKLQDVADMMRENTN